MTIIRTIHAGDLEPISALSALLVDAVDGGASVGFLAPLSPVTATRYWTALVNTLGSSLTLWVAQAEDTIIGAIQLSSCEKENGMHRAEIQKLFVHAAHRGKGIASELMAAAEQHARAAGRTLLVLDTEAGSLAESVYRHLGWQKAGEIPEYAASPDGRLHATAYYFKNLKETTTP